MFLSNTQINLKTLGVFSKIDIPIHINYTPPLSGNQAQLPISRQVWRYIFQNRKCISCCFSTRQATLMVSGGITMFKRPTLLTLFPALSYRFPMQVHELMVFPDSWVPTSFYVCPRCRNTIDREYMAYCDRCGQCLDWTMHAQAKIVYPGNKKRGARAKKP